MWFSKRKFVKCIDCACCDVGKMKCYPNDEDCEKEYELDDDDLHTPAHCDFFKSKDKD